MSKENTFIEQSVSADDNLIGRIYMNIRLLNGKQLECSVRKTEVKTVADGDFFAKHAFFFLEKADEIFSDSRMFLAPVPVTNGLAYTGTFEQATLGIYIEWWLNCKEDVRHDSDGNDALTFKISGSPLSGANACLCVSRDASVKKNLAPWFP